MNSQLNDQFDVLVAKLGEPAVFSLVEMWERFAGVRHVDVMPLERRWETFLRETNDLVKA